MVPQLTRDEFKALAKQRGYSLAALARLWNLTPARLSQIAADPARAPYFDLALWGMPRKGAQGFVASRRLRALASIAGRSGRKKAAFDLDASWREALAPGATFTVAEEQGSHIPENSEAVVMAQAVRKGELWVTLRFSTGYIEEFAASYLRGSSSFLCATGKPRRPVDAEPHAAGARAEAR